MRAERSPYEGVCELRAHNLCGKGRVNRKVASSESDTSAMQDHEAVHGRDGRWRGSSTHGGQAVCTGPAFRGVSTKYAG